MSSPELLTPTRLASFPISTDFEGLEYSDDATYYYLTGIQPSYRELDRYGRLGAQNPQAVAWVMEPATTKARTFDPDDLLARADEITFVELVMANATVWRIEPAETSALVFNPDGFDAGFWARKRTFVDRIIANLKEDREEALSEGEAVATDAAENACVKVARTIAPCLAPFVPGLKWAAFAGNSGVVSLVLQSFVSNRRLNYEFSPDGKKVSVVEINEHLGHELTNVGIEDAQFLRERAGWVVRRA